MIAIKKIYRMIHYRWDVPNWSKNPFSIPTVAPFSSVHAFFCIHWSLSALPYSYLLFRAFSSCSSYMDSMRCHVIHHSSSSSCLALLAWTSFCRFSCICLANPSISIPICLCFSFSMTFNLWGSCGGMIFLPIPEHTVPRPCVTTDTRWKDPSRNHCQRHAITYVHAHTKLYNTISVRACFPLSDWISQGFDKIDVAPSHAAWSKPHANASCRVRSTPFYCIQFNIYMIYAVDSVWIVPCALCYVVTTIAVLWSHGDIRGFIELAIMMCWTSMQKNVLL